MATAVDSNLSDIELVDLVLGQTPGALDLFFRRHSQLIYHCIRKRADVGDVDDIFQAFFERLIGRDYRILRYWQRGTSLQIYLQVVVRNFVFDAHRARKRQEQTVLRAAEAGAFPTSEQEGVTAQTFVKELRHLAVQAWSTLEGRDRRLVCNKVHRQKSNDAMAEQLQLPAGTLRTAISRAMARFVANLRLTAPEFFTDA